MYKCVFSKILFFSKNIFYLNIWYTYTVIMCKTKYPLIIDETWIKSNTFRSKKFLYLSQKSWKLVTEFSFNGVCSKSFIYIYIQLWTVKNAYSNKFECLDIVHAYLVSVYRCVLLYKVFVFRFPGFGTAAWHKDFYSTQI